MHEHVNPYNFEAAKTFTKPREVVGSVAFNLEQLPGVTDEELRQQVVSYLCEYRLAIPEFSYDLYHTTDENGKRGLSDKAGGELLRTKAQRAVLERQMRGDPIHRELAEEFALTSLDNALEGSNQGDSILWSSLAGPESEGYGKYGFIFEGTVENIIGRDKHVRMRAIRVEDPTLDQANSFLSDIKGTEVANESVDEMLATPELLPFTLHPSLIYIKLREYFDFDPNTKGQRVAESVVKRLSRAIDDFVVVWKRGTREEKLRGLYSLENEATELRKQYEREEEVTQTYEKLVFAKEQFREPPTLAYLQAKNDSEPEKASGSCGTTSEVKSNNPLNIAFGGMREMLNMISTEDKYGSRIVECPDCGMSSVRPQDKLIKTCQHCGSDTISCGKGKSEKKQEQQSEIEIYSQRKKEREQKKAA